MGEAGERGGKSLPKGKYRKGGSGRGVGEQLHSWLGRSNKSSILSLHFKDII